MLIYDNSFIDLFGIFFQAAFIQNIILANFLGMCSYISCSSSMSTANGLGISVIVVLTGSSTINWIVNHYITRVNALSNLKIPLLSKANIDLNYLELIIFISIIAAFVQILEIVIEKTSQKLYKSLGIFLPLIAVNCAILGGTLIAFSKSYSLIQTVMYCFGCGVGWWMAICLMAAIRIKLQYSNINMPKNIQGSAIVFIVTGLIGMAFLGLFGINLTN